MSFANSVSSARFHGALSAVRNQAEKLYAALFQKRDRLEPDPGGMRDEIEREYIARESRWSR
jgi:hypothetical protein